MVRKSYINMDKMAHKCRICLTRSTSTMYDLTDEMVLDDNETFVHLTILEALEKVVATKVFLNEEFPQFICPICVSILKMTYKFLYQFEESQNKLMKIFKKAPTYKASDVEIADSKAEQIDEDVNKQASAPVEIIYRQNKFNLKDILVVEESKDEKLNFNGFLNNLGQEVSATFAGKSKVKCNNPDSGEDAVSIYINNENGVLPIKELKFDDNTNSIDYVLEDCEDTDKIEFIEIDSPEYVNLETFTIEGISSDDTELNKVNDKLDETEVHDVIESLIIETSGTKTENNDEQNGNVDDVRMKKYIKVGKRKKLIQEEKLEDIIIMGPVNEENKEELAEENEDDIFEKEIQFPCELCKKIFATKKALRAHKKRSHFPKNRQYTCEICGYKNNTRSGYVHHKNKHIGKKFTCEVCSKTYYTRAVLKVHMATHINKRQHLCNVCGKGFNYANALVYHMRLHTGERSYKCEYCGDMFRMPNSLKRHLCTHTGERPYKCRFCDRGFCSSGEVQCHENIHTGYRPYHCKHCLKGFTKTHNLKLHLLSHTGPHGCEICGKTFIEMSILSMHYKIAHKDLLEKDEEGTD